MIRGHDSNWLWTGSSWLLNVAVTSSSWFTLVIETGCDKLKLVFHWYWNWLWLALTGSYCLLRLALTSSSSLLKLAVTSSNWFSLVAWQAHSYLWRKSFLYHHKELPNAFKILHGRPGNTQYDRCEIQRQKKTAKHCNKCHAGRELPPLQIVLIQHKEGNWAQQLWIEASWSWAQKLRIQHGKYQNESTGL